MTASIDSSYRFTGIVTDDTGKPLAKFSRDPLRLIKESFRVTVEETLCLDKGALELHLPEESRSLKLAHDLLSVWVACPPEPAG